VMPAFEAVEAAIRPERLPDPHPLSTAFGETLPGAAPSPEAESAGIFRVNMVMGRRNSAADAFLRPAGDRVAVRTGREVARITLSEGRATGIETRDGARIAARAGVILSAGAIETPMILMRSGLGPAATLRARGIEVAREMDGVGANLHDHPAVALHHAGPGSGYGLTPAQLPLWAFAPVDYALRGRGRLASNTVEAGAFLASGGTGAPDCQVHFIPCRIGHAGRAIVWGAGYTADVCVSRPASRGRLGMAGPFEPEIDLGLLSDPADLATLRAGVRRLRALLAAAPFGRRRAPEVFPGPEVAGDDALDTFIRARAGTSYHPVGSVRMGGAEAPVTAELALRGTEALWVADCSVMPAITSANTNAPAMMIGWRAGEMVARATREGRIAA
ncbi:MAG: GMC oxidoreductase, partial [Pseudomonadota bacterium]